RRSARATPFVPITPTGPPPVTADILSPPRTDRRVSSVPRPRQRSPMARPDLTVLAIPAFVGAMGAEFWWQRKHPARPGEDRPGDYELNDTIASLSMGIGSLVAPFVTGPLVRRLTPGRTRAGTALLVAGLAAGVATTVGDVLRQKRAHGGELPEAGTL